MTTPAEHARTLIQDAQESGTCAATAKALQRHLEDLETLQELTPGDILGGMLVGTGIAITLFLHPVIGFGMVASGVVIFAVALDSKLMRIKQGKRSIERGIEDLEECLARESTKKPED